MLSLVRDTSAPLKGYLGLSTLLTAADADKIVESANMKVGAYTVAAQPSVPSRIGVAATAVGTADTMGIVIIAGTDVWNNVITETVVPVAGSTVYTTQYFKTVTSVTGAGWVVDAGAGNDTIVVGVLASGGLDVKKTQTTFQVVTGNVWINDTGVAIADATAFKLTAGQSLTFVPRGVLSMISDGSGATIQALFWDV